MKPTAKGPIEYYTHSSIPDRVIAERVAHHNRMLAEELPDDPPFLVEDAVRRMRSLPSTTRVHAWVLRRGRSITAEATLQWEELTSNRRMARVYVRVEPQLRRRGIGTRLLGFAVERSRMALRPLLLANSSGRLPAGAAFLRQLGFRQALGAQLNQLAIDRLDRGLLARWLAAGPERAADYVIEVWHGPVPEQWLVPFAELCNVMNTEPRGELQIEDTTVTPKMIREEESYLFANDTRRLIACARHADSGTLAGFTEMAWNPKRATIVWQRGTGVVEAHRNRGLGRWLKAANMEAMLRLNGAARFVRTGNADSNAPMLAINRQMGFAPLIAEISWQGSAPAIAQRLPAYAGRCRAAAYTGTTRSLLKAMVTRVP